MCHVKLDHGRRMAKQQTLTVENELCGAEAQLRQRARRPRIRNEQTGLGTEIPGIDALERKNAADCVILADFPKDARAAQFQAALLQHPSKSVEPWEASGPDKLWSDSSLDKINTEGLQLEHCANARLSAGCPTGLESCQKL
jgi:hypothetical protein